MPSKKDVHIMEMTPERKERVTAAVNEVIQLLKKLAPDQFEALAILDLAAQYIREKYHISTMNQFNVHDDGPVH